MSHPMTQCGNHTRRWLHYGSGSCIISVTKHWKKDHNKTVTAQSGGDSLKLEAGQRPGTKVWRKTVATINWWNSWRRGSRPEGRSPEQVWRKRNRVESEMSRVSAERHSCTRGRRLVVVAAGHSRRRFMRLEVLTRDKIMSLILLDFRLEVADQAKA